MPCRFCGHFNGGHDKICPEAFGGIAADIAVWRKGWDDGRIGEPKSMTNPFYVLGYHRGEIAAEEAEHSVPWSS